MKRPPIQEPKLTEIAKEIVKKRYLRTSMQGKSLETPGEMLWRVAYHMAKAEVNFAGNGVVMEIAKKFYERMTSMKMVCAGKAMFEAGNPGGTGQLSSCFVLPVEDSIDTIFKTLGEAAVIHKNNGGTGFNFSKIRPHGDKVKNVPGAASGPVDFLKAYSAALAAILQGAKRQGANIGILNVDHPDIEEFILLKEKDGTIKNFNISVGITNKFMEAVENNKDWELRNPRTREVVKKIQAKKLFEIIAKQAWKSGDPGLAFLDTIEEGNTMPQYGTIDACNPCVTGDTLIATQNGWEKIKKLVGKNQTILVDERTVGGKGTSLHNVERVASTGRKKVYRVVTKSGFEVRATGDHKILTLDGWQEVLKLKLGQRVLIQGGTGHYNNSSKLPFEWNNSWKGKNGRRYSYNLPKKWSRELGQLLGWLVGDGFIRGATGTHEAYLNLTFGIKNTGAREHFIKLLNEWTNGVRVHSPNERTKQIVVNGRHVIKYFTKLGVRGFTSEFKHVPESIYVAPREAVVGFLQGLFSSDGTVGYVKDKSAYIRLTSKSQALLNEVQLLLLGFGIKTRIYNRSRGQRKNIFPKYVNSLGEVKQYSSDGILWELEISKDVVLKFLGEIGFMFGMHKDKINKLRAKTYYKTRFDDEIVIVEPLGTEEVYDLTESATHSFIANGMVVHNCGEIYLFPYESCNLTSIDLSRHLKEISKSKAPKFKQIQNSNDPIETKWEVDFEELRETVRLGVRFLDDMIEVNAYPIKEIEDVVKRGNRRIGLGVMGFAHLLYKLQIPYNSQEAVKIARKLSKDIYETAKGASEELAEERGSFPNWDLSIYPAKGQPMRNCAVTMVAPTGTISMMADTSSGIEPVFALVTNRRTFYEDSLQNHSTRELVMIDPVFEEHLKKKYQGKGSKYQAMLARIAEGDLSDLSKEERAVFVTTHQISPKWHVKVQAAWQAHFDNSISKTVNFSKESTALEVEKAFKLAWKMKCKGITIYRDGSKDDQVLVNGEVPIRSGSPHSPVSIENDKADLKSVSALSSAGIVCQECGGRLLVQEGCSKCVDCGYSVCG